MGTATLATRLLLAAIFATAAVTKFSNPAASRATFDGFGAGRRLARFGALALAPSELLVAVGLIFVPTARWGGVGAALLLLVFMFGIAIALRHGRRPDCGCFGALRPTPIGTSTLVRNAALLALAVFLVAAAPGPAIDRWLGDHTAAEVVITCTAVAGALAALIYLPPLLDAVLPTVTPGRAVALAIGKRAPDFTLIDTGGAQRTSQSLYAPGIPLVLIFGSATCGACVKLFPSLARWQRSLSGRLKLALVIGGDVDAARSIAEQHGIAGVLADPEGDVSRSYGIAWSPGAVSLAPEGRVASGPTAGPDEIEELLRSTLHRTEPIPTPWIQTTSAA
jgi:peroxiredoxin